MNKSMRKLLIVAAVVAIAAVLTVVSQLFAKNYHTHKFESLQEYAAYSTLDGRYTVSLRDVTELGLMNAVRLDVYLIDNASGDINYIETKRLDLYDDPPSYIDFYESKDAISVRLHSRSHTDELIIKTKTAA